MQQRIRSKESARSTSGGREKAQLPLKLAIHVIHDPHDFGIQPDMRVDYIYKGVLNSAIYAAYSVVEQNAAKHECTWLLPYAPREDTLSKRRECPFDLIAYRFLVSGVTLLNPSRSDDGRDELKRHLLKQVRMIEKYPDDGKRHLFVFLSNDGFYGGDIESILAKDIADVVVVRRANAHRQTFERLCSAQPLQPFAHGLVPHRFVVLGNWDVISTRNWRPPKSNAWSGDDFERTFSSSVAEPLHPPRYARTYAHVHQESSSSSSRSSQQTLPTRELCPLLKVERVGGESKGQALGITASVTHPPCYGLDVMVRYTLDGWKSVNYAPMELLVAVGAHKYEQPQQRKPHEPVLLKAVIDFPETRRGCTATASFDISMATPTGGVVDNNAGRYYHFTQPRPATDSRLPEDEGWESLHQSHHH